ncbi:MAG: large ribosomal subunit protein bL35 [Acidobacteriaceae bacterium]
MPRKQTTTKYKLKTHKATSKRFRLTGTGIVVRTKGGKSHLRRRTSKRVKQQFTEMLPVKGRGIIQRIHRLAPYLKKAE